MTSFAHCGRSDGGWRMDIELQKIGLRGISMICASGDTGAYSDSVEDRLPK